jgi:hypothetical protein
MGYLHLQKSVQYINQKLSNTAIKILQYFFAIKKMRTNFTIENKKNR